MDCVDTLAAALPDRPALIPGDRYALDALEHFAVSAGARAAGVLTVHDDLPRDTAGTLVTRLLRGVRP